MFNGCKRYNNSEMPKKCEKKKFISDQMFGNLVYFLFGIPSFLRVLFCHLIVIKYITTEHLPKRIQSER